MSGSKLLVTVEHGQDVYRCELCDLDVYGIECQWSLNGVLLQTRRFTSAGLAVQWAEEQRRAILAGIVKWSGPGPWPPRRDDVRARPSR